MVSADAKVANVTVGYAFSGCSGVETLSGLAESIMLPVTQFGRTLPDGRGGREHPKCWGRPSSGDSRTDAASRRFGCKAGSEASDNAHS